MVIITLDCVSTLHLFEKLCVKIHVYLSVNYDGLQGNL